MSAGGGEVKVEESSMVTPSVQTPRHGLWLSPLDILKAKCGHTPTVYLYGPDSGAVVHDFFDVARLKAAMAKALVAFYPLAGRLGMDATGRAEIDCAGQGTLFLVAHSDLNLSDIQASPEVTRLFVPRMDDSPSVISAIQVTFLKCGGVALGTAMHHAAVDAISAFHFFQTWAAFSRDGKAAATLELPCHDRALLRARSPPFVHPDALTTFLPKQPTCELPPSVHVVNEMFVISKDQVAALKHAGTGTGGGRAESTFCVVTAHVWRCLCMARRMPPDTMTHLAFSANIRRSLRPPLPDKYFGNGIITLSAAGKAQDIIASEDNQPLVSVVSLIRGAITRMDDELVRSAVDYLELEMAGSLPAMLLGSIPLTDLRVVSWLGMPVYDADFGWGRPTVMQGTPSKSAGIAHLLDGIHGSLRILVSMEHPILDDFRRLLYANMPTQSINLKAADPVV